MTALRPLYVDHGAAAVRLEGPALIEEAARVRAGDMVRRPLDSRRFRGLQRPAGKVVGVPRQAAKTDQVLKRERRAC